MVMLMTRTVLVQSAMPVARTHYQCLLRTSQTILVAQIHQEEEEEEEEEEYDDDEEENENSNSHGEIPGGT